ncbi:restriction endonuclease subunit S [Flavobacterium sp. RS13.1]|uniref:restriction endonuclease subunit S n=1 Tax=Flavobacterium sp. RS13.1 TaxID=3400345 RepID=UPI003AADEB9D
MEKLQPKLRFPEFAGDWKLKKLSDTIKSIDSGWSPQCEDYSSDINEWGVLKTTSVVWEGFNENENKKLPIKLKPKENIEVVANDILITRAGPTNRVGVSVHVDRVRPKLMLSDKLIRLRTNENYSSKFISILLSLENIKNQIVSKSSGLATSQTNISQNILLNVKLSVPLFHEQTKIANFLSSIDEKINLLKEKKALLEDYKKGMMQKIFNQEVRFKDDNGKDFEEWNKNILSEVFDYKKGNGLSKDKLEANGKNKCILYGELYTKYREVIFNVISKTNSNEGLNSEKGDLLIPSSTTTSGIDLANVTALGFENILIGGDITVLRSFKNVNSVFYAYYLSNHKKEEIASYAQGITIVHLYYSHIKDMIIDVPCLKEQTKIANFLSAIDEKIALVATQIEDTQEYKKGLLQQMFV